MMTINEVMILIISGAPCSALKVRSSRLAATASAARLTALSNVAVRNLH